MPRSDPAAVARAVRIVHQDDQLLVLDKPPGIPTTSPDGRGCLVEIAQRLDPRAPHLHASSRLDAEVSGLCTFARTSEAIRALLAARSAGTYRRLYHALTLAAPAEAHGTWSAAIALDPADRRRRRAVPGGAAAPEGARQASTDYAIVARSERSGACLLHLRPRTGRTHQLRVHCAAAGSPIFGDIHYGGERRHVLADGRVASAPRVMLHCAALSLPDLARRGGTLELGSEPPADFCDAALALGIPPEG